MVHFLSMIQQGSFSRLLRPALLAGCRALSSVPLLALNRMKPIKEAFPKKRRWGRGPGSGRGKLCGHGHQRSYSHPVGFEGGQTPLYKTRPKVGFNNANAREMVPLNLGRIQEFIDLGRIKPLDNELITIRDLVLSGLITNPADGVKLLARGKDELRTPIHIEVSMASESAIEAVEQVGGTVTSVFLNDLALRALIKPFKFELLPRRARPPPKLVNYYLDRTKSGYLSPEVQIRNLKLFGSVTSEKKYREEHERYMAAKRAAGDINYKHMKYGPAPLLAREQQL